MLGDSSGTSGTCWLSKVVPRRPVPISGSIALLSFTRQCDFRVFSRSAVCFRTAFTFLSFLLSHLAFHSSRRTTTQHSKLHALASEPTIRLARHHGARERRGAHAACAPEAESAAVHTMHAARAPVTGVGLHGGARLGGCSLPGSSSDGSSLAGYPSASDIALSMWLQPDSISPILPDQLGSIRCVSVTAEPPSSCGSMSTGHAALGERRGGCRPRESEPPGPIERVVPPVRIDDHLAPALRDREHAADVRVNVDVDDLTETGSEPDRK